MKTLPRTYFCEQILIYRSYRLSGSCSTETFSSLSLSEHQPVMNSSVSNPSNASWKRIRRLDSKAPEGCFTNLISFADFSFFLYSNFGSCRKKKRESILMSKFLPPEVWKTYIKHSPYRQVGSDDDDEWSSKNERKSVWLPFSLKFRARFDAHQVPPPPPEV